MMMLSVSDVNWRMTQSTDMAGCSLAERVEAVTLTNGIFQRT